MSTSAAAVTSGLCAASGEAVPLEGVKVEARIRDFGATVVLSQRYRNTEAQPIEAVYKFPLDEGAAVCGFEAEIAGRRVVGRVEEREKALEEYDDALAKGHGAYLLDEERADVFTVSVGNVPPGQEVVLRITTVAELALEGDDVRFTLPTTVAPRYAPAEHRHGVGISEAERVNAPVALSVPYGLQLDVDVEMSAPVRSVESPTHPITVSIDGRRARVSLSGRDAAMDRDFVLKLGVADSQQPGVLVERARDGAAYALLSFRPQFEARPVPCEVIFLVDRSGSMEGTSIEEAKNALQLCLRSLRPGCHFNVIGFGSDYRPLFPQSRPYGDDTLKAAADHVRTLEADLGGTELLPALAFALGPKPIEGLPRQLFLITDGEVSNTDEVIALVGEHAGRARVFTFGVGAGASQHLVKGLARAGEGEAEFIAPGERIEAKVMRQFGRALSVALSNVRVDWNGLAVEQAPHLPPPVFDRGRVLVYGRLATAAAAPVATVNGDTPAAKAGTRATVVLTAKGPAGDLHFELPVNPEQASPGELVATLWARRRIRDLEEGASEFHAPRGSRQARAKSADDRVRAEAIRLGKQYGLVSRDTSYVAVEQRADGTPGEILLRKVPSALARGWHGAPPLACGSPSFSYAVPEAAEEEGWFRATYAAPAPPRSAGSAPRPSSVRPLDELMALQLADGSWRLEKAFVKIVGVRLDHVKKALESLAPEIARTGATASGTPVDHVVATALALRWLERHCPDTRDEWRMAAEKSQAWLVQAVPGDASWLQAVLDELGV